MINWLHHCFLAQVAELEGFGQSGHQGAFFSSHASRWWLRQCLSCGWGRPYFLPWIDQAEHSPALLVMGCLKLPTGNSLIYDCHVSSVLLSCLDCYSLAQIQAFPVPDYAEYLCPQLGLLAGCLMQFLSPSLVQYRSGQK